MAIDKGMNETAFASQIEDLLKIFRWRYCHFRPAWSTKGWRTAIRGDKGFPDYVAVRNGMCLFIELKGDKGKLSPDQGEWAKELEAVAKNNLGVMYYQWHPSDFDRAMEVLKSEEVENKGIRADDRTRGRDYPGE